MLHCTLADLSPHQRTRHQAQDYDGMTEAAHGEVREAHNESVWAHVQTCGRACDVCYVEYWVPDRRFAPSGM